MPVEVHTASDLVYQFFPVNGACFAFKVRAPNDAHLALTTRPEPGSPMTEIFIGGWGNTKSVIRKNGVQPDVAEAPTGGILDAGEYRGFWIRWYQGVVTVGREGEAAAFLSHEDPYLHPVNFVGVCTGWGASGSWLIEPCAGGQQPGYAPQLSPPGWSNPTSGRGAGAWVPASGGQVPPEAVQGGVDLDGQQLYIARARHEGALIPGKLVPSHGVCYVPWGGGEHGHNEYDVLCAASGNWVRVSGGQIPPGAIPAGESEAGEPLFVGRANHNGTVTIGKVQPSHNCCYIPFGGQELAYTEYEIFIAQ